MNLLRKEHSLSLLILLVLFIEIEAKPSKPAKLKLKRENNKSTTKDVTGDIEVFFSFSFPKNRWCNKLDRTLRFKSVAHRHITKAVDSLEEDKSISAEEKKFHIGRFRILEKELNETQDQVEDAINWLNDVLKGDYKDVINMKITSQKRLEGLRDATVKEEQEYSAILKAEVRCLQSEMMCE